MAQKIIPHLWFDKEAEEACRFYTSVFPDSKILSMQQLNDTPSGDCDIVSFELSGYQFMAISAGPYFKPNPSISFMLNFDPSKDVNAKENLDRLWNKLIEGGKALMPLGKYDFSEWYGWVEDKFGVSWQLILTNPEGEPRPFIVPSLLFVKEVDGRAQEAIDYYLSVFRNTKKGLIAAYPAGMDPKKEGRIMFGEFMLEGQWFAAMDGGMDHMFNFTEGISLLISCENQEEIDYYWEKLSKVPESEQCGWVKDQFGVSWQVHPVELQKMMETGSKEQVGRVTQAFLKMKKFDIAELKKAFDGK